MRENIFYKCKKCGKIVAIVEPSRYEMLTCCDEPMERIIPNTTDAAGEKHVPVIERVGNKVTVKVGSVTHPMTPEHYIGWIILQTDKGNQRKILTPDMKPEADFYVADDEKVEAALEYCNLHGLWSTKTE